MIKITPDEAVLIEWVGDFKFDHDVFYLTEDSPASFQNHLNDAVIYTKKDFFKHTLANDIKYINNYEFWLMDAAATHIIVARNGWFETLPPKLKHRLLALQLELNRGFIYPGEVLSRYTFKNKTILTSNLVDQLSHRQKAEILLSGVEEEEDDIAVRIKEKMPQHIKSVANSFSAVHGSNCFGATLFAMTKNEKYLPEWVHQKPFLAGLKNNSYKLASVEARQDDVIVWADDKGTVRHACYYLGNGLYFNKSGQKIYNPWKIVSWREMNDDWGHYGYSIYRK